MTPKPPRRRAYSTSSPNRRGYYDHHAPRGRKIDLGLDKFADSFFGVIQHTSSSLARSLGDEHAPGKSAGFGRGSSFVTPTEAGFTETPFHVKEGTVRVLSFPFF